MGKTKIEWTATTRSDGTVIQGYTANLWIGCVEAAQKGCDNCYARILDNRWGHKNWGNDVPRRAVKKVWSELNKYQAEAANLGEMHRVFVGSMMDIFEKDMPLIEPITLIDRGAKATFGTGPFTTTAQLRQYFFEVFVPRCPNLLFLLLTKRPSNINKYIPESWKTNPPANVMFGASISDPDSASRIIPQLLQVNGRRFLSVEPMLAEISLKEYLWQPKSYCEECGDGGVSLATPCNNLCSFKPISWVIVGGESGHGRRPFNPDWARKLRDECKFADVPFFFKQWDKVQAIPEDLMIREFPKL